VHDGKTCQIGKFSTKHKEYPFEKVSLRLPMASSDLNNVPLPKQLLVSYDVNIMDIYDKKALKSKRLPLDPVAYADMEERYNKTILQNQKPRSEKGTSLIPSKK
jgi:hypothetical protein